MLSERKAALVLSLGVRTLQRHRRSGNGPAFIRLSVRRIAYRYSDLMAWVNQCRVSGAGEGGEHA